MQTSLDSHFNAMKIDALSVLNGFKDAVFILNNTGTILLANKAATELFCFSIKPERLIGISELLPSKHRAKVLEYINQAFEGEDGAHELQLGQKEATKWFRVTYSSVNERNDATTYVSLSMQDITERKKVELFKQELSDRETKLFQSRKLFESFMENTPLAAWITDAAGVLQYMNPLFRRLYSIPPSKAAINMFALFNHEMAEEYYKNNKKVIEEGKAIETIERAILADGSIQTAKVFKFPVPSNGLQMVGGWSVDITEQIKMQEELSHSIERYQFVNKATSDAIYDWDLINGTIYRGDGFKDNFGYSEKLTSLRFRLSRIHPEDVDVYKSVVFGKLRDPQSEKWVTEYRFMDAHDIYHHVIDKAFIIRSDNKAIRVIGAIQDITELKNLQNQLMHQEQKNRRQIMRSIIETQEKERRLLSVELHDNVNQVLTSCKLMLEAALGNTEAAPFLIEKGYQSINTVISDIRELCHELNPSALEDVGLVEAIIEMVDRINASGKIFLTFTHEGCEGNMEIAEKDQVAIFRIIQEQVNNIVKHARATKATIHLIYRSQKASISIQDDGVGFNLTEVKKGIGLKSIQNRVDYYSGTLTIDAVPGNGCCIQVQLYFGG